MVIHTRPEMSHPRQDMTHAHQTAPTQFVEANGIRFAYRRFGKSGGMPLVFNQHFTGTMDHWDPAVTDGLAATREVIPRSRGQRKSCACPDRSHHQMGRSTGEAVRLSEIDPSADAGRQWRQRRDHLFGELLNSAAASPECTADPLSGRRPRVAVSISRSVRPARLSVLVRRTSAMSTHSESAIVTTSTGPRCADPTNRYS